MIGRHLLQHVGHEQKRAALNALGANGDWRLNPQNGRKHLRHRPHRLGGRDQQHGVHMRKVAGIGGWAHIVMQAHAGQALLVFACTRHFIGMTGVARPQHDVCACARRHIGQSRAPGAGADHANAGESLLGHYRRSRIYHGPVDESASARTISLSGRDHR